MRTLVVSMVSASNIVTGKLSLMGSVFGLFVCRQNMTTGGLSSNVWTMEDIRIKLENAEDAES